MIDLRNLTVNVRPLSSSQAVDLGMMIARVWFLPLWLLWLRRCLLFLLVFSMAFFTIGSLGYYGTNINFLSLFNGLFLVLLLMLLWLKPYIEMPLVYFIGQKLFDNQYDRKQCQLDIKQISYQTSLALLFRYRLSLRRQMLMPIMLLEQPKVKQRKQRFKVLSHRQNSMIVFHTITFNLIEIGLYLGLFVLILWLLPENMVYINNSHHSLAEVLLESVLIEQNVLAKILFLLIVVLIISILAPFYIAGGFALYVCKRSQFEGWDIELKFRKLAKRFQDEQQKFLFENSMVSSIKPEKQP